MASDDTTGVGIGAVGDEAVDWDEVRSQANSLLRKSAVQQYMASRPSQEEWQKPTSPLITGEPGSEAPAPDSGARNLWTGQIPPSGPLGRSPWTSTENPLGLGTEIAYKGPGASPPSLVQPSTGPAQPTLPPEAEAVWSRMIPQESGGKQFDASGGPLTSKAGAIGIAQVLPDTGKEVAQRYGIPWDASRFATDPNYNSTLGRIYYGEQVQKYGNPSVAAAAYNAGPAAVDKALASGGRDWLSHLPAETQNYVASVTGAHQDGAPQARDASAIPSTLGGFTAGGLGPVGSEGQSPSLDPRLSALRSLMQYQFIQSLFPQHTISPVEYDPWKYVPGASRPSQGGGA